MRKKGADGRCQHYLWVLSWTELGLGGLLYLERYSLGLDVSLSQWDSLDLVSASWYSES